MANLTPQQVCDSKQKLTLLSAQYIIQTGDKGLSQDYYICRVCGNYHITTVNKSVEKKRKNKILNKLDKATWYAMRNKLNKNRRKK